MSISRNQWFPRFFLISCVMLGGAASPPSSLSVRERLAQWLMLVSPGNTALPAETYETFLTGGPVWPLQSRIMWRYQNALAQTSDSQVLARLCPAVPLTQIPPFLVCAEYLPSADEQARRLWVSGTGSEQDERNFLSRFEEILTPGDHWNRYLALEHRGNVSAAKRMLPLLPADRQALLRARLAARISAPDADSLYADLTSQEREDDVLVLYRLHSLRRHNRLDEALSLWNDAGLTLQSAKPSHDWSLERAGLSRTLLLAGRIQDAYALAQDMTLPLTDIDRQEAQNLSGFIALRILHQPEDAIRFFAPLQQATSLAMQARGWYWLGCARNAQGQEEQAREAFQQAARFPTTFHGQMAEVALTGGASFLVSGTSTPEFDATLKQALRSLPSLAAVKLSRPDLAEAARELSGMGETEHAKDFLLLLLLVNPASEGQKAVADLGQELNIPAAEVFASHALARKGVALYPQGFPDPWPDASTVPQGLLPAIIRQESGFDSAALSPAHAVGLLQLLPGAAADVARKAHMGRMNTSAAALLNPQMNLKLGNAYVSQLLERFGNVIPFALAAYNAGPHRVDLWLKANPLPDPLTDEALLNWIECLPYRETRVYIENIEASMMVYRVSTQHE